MKRNMTKLAIAAVAVLPLLAGCSEEQSPSESSPAPSAPQEQGSAAHGPIFPQCGGISDETIQELTRVSGLKNTATNSVGCQWLQNGGIIGPHFSFTWFRGSPIGRERKTQELSRTSVEDISVEGNDGFVAIGTDPLLGDNLCEIGIQFGDDFIEWSVSFAEQNYPPPCQVAEELTRQSIVNAK
ncbi:hypothetical protein BCA37_23645 [Mycobacterium sp. djl-10]|nr:hypothetical protein BCA37_23645 [Mycobacterium sp. djl-10]